MPITNPLKKLTDAPKQANAIAAVALGVSIFALLLVLKSNASKDKK